MVPRKRGGTVTHRIVEAVIETIVVCRHLDVGIGYLVLAALAEGRLHRLAVRQDS